jgi:hypothetical protein
MGYHLTILRTRSGKIDPIQLDELRALRSEFAVDAPAPAGRDCEVAVERSGRRYIWSYTEGEIWSSTPSDDEISAMIDFSRLPASIVSYCRRVGAWCVPRPSSS